MMPETTIATRGAAIQAADTRDLFPRLDASMTVRSRVLGCRKRSKGHRMQMLFV